MHGFKRLLGGLFLIGFHGATIPPHHAIVADLQERNLGGVILFDRLLAKKLDTNNIITASQVQDLTGRLRELAGDQLLIGVDQEGGKVCRLAAGKGFPAATAPAELGTHDDPVLTEIHSRATACMLSRLGINLNLAPVVDLNVYPDNPIIGRLGRSFSADADKVVQHAAAWIEGHRAHAVLTCLKHFPGHGSSRNDSHQGFVDISDTWTRDELRPFAELIAQDLADTVMTGHLFNRHLDPDNPATLSFFTITRELRDKLHYQGVVLTDDLQMKAITDRYGLDTAICLALAAGVDMIVIGNNLAHDPAILTKAVDAVISGIHSGKLNEERLLASLSRIHQLKKTLHRHEFVA